MGRKLAVALVLLAAARLPFVKPEGSRVAVAASPHLQSSLAALLTRLKLEVLRRRLPAGQLYAGAQWTNGPSNVACDVSKTAGPLSHQVPETGQLPGAPEAASSEPSSRREGNAVSGEQAPVPSQAGPDWLQRLGFNAGEWGLDKEEEVGDSILRHLGLRKEAPTEQPSSGSRNFDRTAGAVKEGQDKTHSRDEGGATFEAHSSELFAVDSDGAGRSKSGHGEEQPAGEGSTLGLDPKEDGDAGLKEKVGLQILQDLADPVISLYKRAVAKGAELEAVASLRMLADIAASMKKVTAGMEPWSLSDLTLGLYLLSIKHSSEGVQDVIPGEDVTDPAVVEDLIYHLELARGAYAKDAAGLARISMLRESRVVKFEAKATLLRPAYYIGVDDPRQLVVLGIRGTTQAHDLFTDLCTSGEAFLDGGFAHAGMLRAATWFVENEAQTLKKQLQQNKGYALRIVGHSLGGGTATLTTILLRDHPEVVGVPRGAISAACFAAPACLSRDLANWTSDFVATLVMQDDAVPRASARAMDRLRREVEQTDWSLSQPGESLASLRDAASSSLESLQPTLKKLQTVAMEYAPAVLASKLKSEDTADVEKGDKETRADGQRQEGKVQSSLAEDNQRDMTRREDIAAGRPAATGDDLRAEGLPAPQDSGDDWPSGSHAVGHDTVEQEGARSNEHADGLQHEGVASRGQEGAVDGPQAELVAPGRLYHLVYKDKKKSPGEAPSDPTPRRYRLIRGTKDARFSRVVLSESMLQDHASREAYWGLREVLKSIPVNSLRVSRNALWQSEH